MGSMELLLMYTFFLSLVSGKDDLADWLFLASFIVCVVGAALTYLEVPVAKIAFALIGIALAALALFVL